MLPYALLLPQLVVVVAFFLWPALRAFREAFVQSNAFGIGERFAGLENFASGVWVSSYAHAAVVTLVLATITTVGSMALGLLLAVQVERVRKGQSIYRTLFLWTYAIPGAVAGSLWLFLFEPGIGPGARAFDALGAHWNAALNPTQALLLVAAIGIWQQSAFCFLFFTAGLQAIPRELHEAGALDGAGRTRTFWSITMPLLSPVTFYVLVMNVVYAVFGLFGIIDIVTQGGPGNSTTTLVYRLYVDAFQNADTTVAGAESIVLLAIVVGFTALQFRALRRRIHYR
jgi:sn-glycerol 3-phosphate transport system permease protein